MWGIWSRSPSPSNQSTNRRERCEGSKRGFNSPAGLLGSLYPPWGGDSSDAENPSEPLLTQKRFRGDEASSSSTALSFARPPSTPLSASQMTASMLTLSRIPRPSYPSPAPASSRSSLSTGTPAHNRRSKSISKRRHVATSSHISLHVVPPEVLRLIFDYVEPSSAFNVRLVARRWDVVSCERVDYPAWANRQKLLTNVVCKSVFAWRCMIVLFSVSVFAACFLISIATVFVGLNGCEDASGLMYFKSCMFASLLFLLLQVRFLVKAGPVVRYVLPSVLTISVLVTQFFLLFRIAPTCPTWLTAYSVTEFVMQGILVGANVSANLSLLYYSSWWASVSPKVDEGMEWELRQVPTYSTFQLV